jgi:hypothetical protein
VAASVTVRRTTDRSHSVTPPFPFPSVSSQAAAELAPLLSGAAHVGAAASLSAAASPATAVRLEPLPLLTSLVQCILLPALLGAGLRASSAGRPPGLARAL